MAEGLPAEASYSLSEWRRQLQEQQALPKTERPSLQRQRAYGGGRKAMLSSETELAILAWVVLQRQQVALDYFRHVVTVADLLAYAIRVSNLKKLLSDGWLWGCMDRHHLSLRSGTTNKVSDTPVINDVLEEFRFLHHELLSDRTRGINVANMDETAIYYDLHHKRNIDFRGAGTVAAHQTKQPDYRVAVVVWVTLVSSALAQACLSRTYSQYYTQAQPRSSGMLSRTTAVASDAATAAVPVHDAVPDNASAMMTDAVPVTADAELCSGQAEQDLRAASAAQPESAGARLEADGEDAEVRAMRRSRWRGEHRTAAERS